MDKTAIRLEFDKIKEKLLSFSACSLGKKRIEELMMYRQKSELLYELELTNEAIRLIMGYGRLPLGGLHDNEDAIKKAAMDGILYPQALLSILSTLDAVHAVKNYQEAHELAVPHFDEFVSQLNEIPSLSRAILRCIELDGSIKDNASPTLASIRRRMRHLEALIHSKMEQLASSQKEYLSEAIVTTRNDRFVLPVKSVSKGNVRGIVHAESASSKTAYIEPESVVLMNNELTEEKNKEQDEIERILFELSQEVKKQEDILKVNQLIMQDLDFMFAKGAYACSINGVIAHIEDDLHCLSLKQARHPLIDPSKVVANDIEMQEPYHMLLITGSNTGGKTVALKTVGLLSMMTLSGLAIPCVKANIPFYDQIFCDLGDEQSIEQSLSTFSSHMKRIIDIVDHVTHSSLVLIDEIGSGTDPREGECLAEAILDELHEYHCHVLASTHYSGLKKYAKEKPFVLFASVEFDLDTMRPTYHLLTGLIGQSYAFEISSRLGLSPKIVDRARQIKEESMSEEDRLLENLENELETNRQLQEKLEASMEEYRLKLEKLENKKKKIEASKEKILDAAKVEANQIIDEAKEEVQIVLDELKQQSREVKPHMINNARHELDGLKYVKDEKIESTTKDHDYQKGERVLILSVKREGVVTDVKKNGQLIVSLGGLKMQLKKDEVQYIGKSLAPKKTANTRSVKKVSTGHYEINVIGMRYEEAMRVVDKFIDDALVNNYPSVRIVHGMGTGALRKGVRQLLDRHKHVVSYRDGGPNEGGLGATLVYF